MSMISGTFATNSVNADDDVFDDQPDYTRFTPASKIAYAATYEWNTNFTSFPANMRTFSDIVSFFNANNVVATAVDTNKNTLKPGDIVQVKNSDSGFLVYKGISNGQIVLEDLYAQYVCSPQSFDRLFTGKAIFVKHASNNMQTIDGSDINDNPIHDSSIETSPMRSGLSTSATIKTEWKNAWQRQDFKDRAKQLVSGKNSNKDKVNAIFIYVRDQYAYSFHKNTLWSVSKVVSSKSGNCCELARMIYCLAKSAQQQNLLSLSNDDFRFKKANCNFKNYDACNHVWVQFKVGPSNDVWQSADACSNSNTLGTHSGTINWDIGYIYSSDLDW